MSDLFVCVDYKFKYFSLELKYFIKTALHFFQVSFYLAWWAIITSNTLAKYCHYIHDENILFCFDVAFDSSFEERLSKCVKLYALNENMDKKEGLAV